MELEVTRYARGKVRKHIGHLNNYLLLVILFMPSYHTFVSHEFESKFDDTSDNDIDTPLMNTTDALNALVKADPTRIFTAYASQRAVPNKTERWLAYDIFAHPGYNGTDCQLFSSSLGFEKPVADCIAALQQPEQPA